MIFSIITTLQATSLIKYITAKQLYQSEIYKMTFLTII